MAMWRWLSRIRPDARQLDDEIQFHLAEETRLKMEAGMSAEDARASARRDFGNVLIVRETTQQMWASGTLKALVQDVRYALRLLTRHRLFAGFSIASLALGIGGTTAIFSLYDAIVLRDLPVRAPDRLVTLSLQQRGVNRTNSFLPYPQ